jgi:hypothetical protein
MIYELRFWNTVKRNCQCSKDVPEERAVQPALAGVVVELPEVGGRHHRHERRTA